jgi:predicted MFS family arabinose efflux permease
VRWLAAAVAGIGAVLGSVIGARMMLRVNERTLRVVVIVIGVILTLGMFARSRQQAAPVHAPTTIEVRTNHSQQLRTVRLAGRLPRTQGFLSGKNV